MKFSPIVLLLFASAFPVFAQDLPVTVQISNIDVGKGNLYMAVSDSNESYKKRNPVFKSIVEPVSSTVTLNLVLPAGEYVVSVYQDSNMNGKLDTNLVGMPKEPVGISNYDGKSIPGGFDKLKTAIRNADAVLTVQMIKL